MNRALQLTDGLSGERNMWILDSQKLSLDIENLLGDMLLAVGSISYLGAFIGEYRYRIIQEFWIPKIMKENIICSQQFSLIERIGNELEIQSWVLKGLPLDNTSIENTIIMNISQQYPLIIDPQNQASKYIINSESNRGEDR